MEDPRIARTRDRVLDAAREILLDEGLDALTHSEVARRTGVARASIYRHWPDRVALVREILSLARFPVSPASGELRADLIAQLEALRRALVDGPLAPLLAVLLATAPHDPQLRGLKDDLTRQGHGEMAKLLRAAVEGGVLPKSLKYDRAVAQLAGPVYYRTFVLGERLGRAELEVVVDCFLAVAGNQAAAPAAAKPRKSRE